MPDTLDLARLDVEGRAPDIRKRHDIFTKTGFRIKNLKHT